MKIEEINALINEVFKCSLKESSSIEDIFISLSKPYDPMGWKLCIKKSLVDCKALCCLNEVVNDCKFKMNEVKEGYFVISSK